MRNAFFADMGGFVLQPKKWKRFPINASQLHYLVSHKYIDYHRVHLSEEEIDDRNKKDRFARVITVIQILWFFLNCAGRVAQHRAVTTIEITTLALFFVRLEPLFWYHKPSDVISPIILTIDQSAEDILRNAGKEADKPWFRTPLDFVGQQEWSWSRYWSFWMGILRGLGDHFCVKTTSNRQDFERHFPADHKGHLRYMFIIHAMYVTINFLGWNLEFPSPTELLLWRIAAIANLCAIEVPWVIDRSLFVLYPKLVAMYQKRRGIASEDNLELPRLATNVPRKRRIGDSIRNNTVGQEPEKTIRLTALLPITVCAGVYAIARAYVLLEDLMNLRALPPTAYQTVQWSLFIPHF